MKRACEAIRRFLASEAGPTATEYAIMLAVIVVVCLIAISSVGNRANNTLTTVANTLPS